MTDDDIKKKLIQMNQRLLLVLGYGTSLILELRNFAPEHKEKDILWFVQAVENVVYQDKPLPPLPEK